MDIDRLNWINLDRRVDRRLHMQAAIEASAVLSGCTEIIRHRARPPSELFVPPSFPDKAGHFSCTLAHCTILHDACVDGVQSLLVLEDDADPQPELDTSFDSFMHRLPDDWLGVWLGGYHHRAPIQLEPGLLRGTGIVLSHAYLLNREGIEFCYDYLYCRPLRVVDQAYWRMHVEVPRFYAPDPFMIGTITSYSDNEQKVVNSAADVDP